MTSVTLVRDPPYLNRFSMERYANGVIEAVRARPGVTVDVPSWPQPASRMHRQINQVLTVPARLRRTTADVFHVLDHDLGHTSAHVPGDRVVITCHDVMLLRARQEPRIGIHGRRLSTARFRWSASFMRRAARVVAVSERTRDDLVELVGVDERNVRVVPNGIDAHFRPLPSARRAQLREQLGVPPDCRLMASVSTTAPYKNPEAALHVLDELTRRGQDVRLVRTGRPFADFAPAAWATSAARGRVIELGRVDDPRLAEVYAMADVLLHASLAEGFGWPPLEAMACGTPAVVSAIRPLTDILSGAAVFAEVGNVGAYADGVERVLAPGARDEWRRRGLDRAAAFSWAQVSERLLDVYQEVVDEGGRRS